MSPRTIMMKRILANLFVVAGFAAVLPLILAVFMPGVAPIPDLPAGLAQVKQLPWIPGGHAMPILLAVAGLIVMLFGSSVATRQLRLLEWNQYRREDAARRVYAYRGGEERVEPTLGKNP